MDNFRGLVASTFDSFDLQFKITRQKIPIISRRSWDSGELDQ